MTHDELLNAAPPLKHGKLHLILVPLQDKSRIGQGLTRPPESPRNDRLVVLKPLELKREGQQVQYPRLQSAQGVLKCTLGFHPLAAFEQANRAQHPRPRLSSLYEERL